MPSDSSLNESGASSGETPLSSPFLDVGFLSEATTSHDVWQAGTSQLESPFLDVVEIPTKPELAETAETQGSEEIAPVQDARRSFSQDTISTFLVAQANMPATRGSGRATAEAETGEPEEEEPSSSEEYLLEGAAYQGGRLVREVNSGSDQAGYAGEYTLEFEEEGISELDAVGSRLDDELYLAESENPYQLEELENAESIELEEETYSDEDEDWVAEESETSSQNREAIVRAGTPEWDRSGQENLASPFLDEELFVGETEAEREERLATLESESPFLPLEPKAFEFEVESRSTFDEERQSEGGYADDGFTLSEWQLAARGIVIAKAGDQKKETAVSIMEAPAVFLTEIIRMARDRAAKDQKNSLAAKLDPVTWFKKFTRITFLGRPLKPDQYLHLEMAKLLKQIESELIKIHGGDAKSVGDLLLNKSPEGISGSRLVSSTATFSMHMFGLAVDVNYLGNPYIQSEDIKALNNILKNAALLMNKPILSYQKGYAKNKFDIVQQLDSILEIYFSLLNKPAELTRLVQASSSSEWRKLSVEEARNKIQGNLDHLAKRLVRVGRLARGVDWGAVDKKDYFKKHAILDFDKRFVEAMENRGLYWGGHYGDMMHFDMRGTGVGYYIEKARLDYAGKARKIAKQLWKEKRYGEHSLKDLKSLYGRELEFGFHESSPSWEGEDFDNSTSGLEFEGEYHGSEKRAEEEEFLADLNADENQFAHELDVDDQEEWGVSEIKNGALVEELDEELAYVNEWGTDEQYQDEMDHQLAEYFELEAPPLLKNPSKADPPGQTLYVQISLGNYKYEHCVKWEKLTKDQRSKGAKPRCLKTGRFGIPPITGIFIPENYVPQSEVDIVLYLHGHKSNKPGLNASIAQYWDGEKYPEFALREEVNNSKKNVILVAPSLGNKSEPGNLVKRGNGLDEYLDKVLEVLKTYGPYQGQSPTIGNLILAAHSGGGTYMRQLALSTNRSASLIKECWGFDCMYSGDTDVAGWFNWARKNQKRGTALFSYYWRGSPAKASKELQCKADREKLRNVKTYPYKSEDKHSHFLLVIPSFRERLQTLQLLGTATGSVKEVEEYLLTDQDHDISFEDESYAEEEELEEGEATDEREFEDEWDDKAFDPELQEAPTDPEEQLELEEFRDELDDEEVENEVEEEGEEESPATGPSGAKSTKEPLAVPASAPVTFAEPPPTRSYWPVRTSRKEGRSVAFKATDGTVVGIRGRSRMFLADRKGKRNGRVMPRWHVGVDLFANVGDEVVACEDGRIVHFGYFYPAKSGQKTYRLLIEHSKAVINYGEVTGDSLSRNNLKEGAWVKAGQVIGFVSDTSMLHFETYRQGTTTSHRWWKSEKKPPRELLNPTKYLLFLQEHGLVRAGTGEPGQPVPSSTLAPQGDIDVNRAIRLNRHYGQKLGWHNEQDRIERFLGFTNYSPDERTFAEAVANWQKRQSLTVDGIIGPNTWKQLRTAIGAGDTTPAPVAATGNPLEEANWRDPHASERKIQLDEQPRYMHLVNPTVRQYTNYSPQGQGPKKEVERVSGNRSFISRVLRIITRDKHFEGLTGLDGLTIGIGDFAAGSDIKFLFEAWRLYPTVFREIFGSHTDEMMQGSPGKGWLAEHQFKRNGRWVNDHGLITLEWLRKGLARLLADRRFYGIQLQFWVDDKVMPSLKTFREYGFELEFTLAAMCGMANSMGRGGMRKLLAEGARWAQGKSGLDREIAIIHHACDKYAHTGGTFRESEPEQKRRKASQQATAVIQHVFEGNPAPSDAQHRAMRILRTNREFPLRQYQKFDGTLGKFALAEGEQAPATPNYNPPPPLPDRLTGAPQ